MARVYRFYRLDDFSDKGLARLFAAFDLLHDYASDGHLIEATDQRPGEIVGWLEDILFTIEETIREIDAHETRGAAWLNPIITTEIQAKEEMES
ncbi:MAG: hypothetical protein HY741_28170 [Chloroflexi bacterium]|nr:hypothetical protein [Chloroflexota bacterium]